MARRVIGILVTIAAFLGGFARPLHAAPYFPEPTSYVMDEADLLTPAEETALAKEIYAFQTSTTHQIAVLTMPNIGGLTPSDYAQQLWQKWGIGQAGRDNGVLLLVAVAEDRIRIQTGRGVGDVLPDVLAGTIIRDDIRPLYNIGSRSAGITQGVHRIMDALTVAAPAVTVYTNDIDLPAPAEPTPPDFTIPILIFTILGIGGLGGLLGYLDRKKGNTGSNYDWTSTFSSGSTPPPSDSSSSSSHSSSSSSSDSGGSTYSGFGGGSSGGGGADG